MPAVDLESIAFAGPLADRIAQPPRDAVDLYWLGQAGFLIRSSRATILIDPYLSDSLARKYRGTVFPHVRMSPPPISVAAIGHVDLVLCTHHHTDHMDPDTLGPLARREPMRFVVPAAKRDEAMRRAGVGLERLVCADAGDILEPLPGVTIRAVRAAHETLERDEAGRAVFLGYGIELDGFRLFHSGDAVPHPGIADDVRRLAAHLALLPVNGRSALRLARGVPGNFFLHEAIALARDCAIPHLIGHHFGMFAFNTIDPSEIDREAGRPGLGVDLRRAEFGRAYRLRNAGVRDGNVFSRSD